MKLFLFLISILSLIYAKSDYQLYKEYLESDDLKNAKLYLLKSLNKSFEKSNLKTIKTRYIEMANLYKKTKSYYKALEYYKLALKLELSREKNDTAILIKLYKNISYCYSKIGNNFKTFKYSYKAIVLANKEYGEDSAISKSLNKELAKVQSKLIANSI